VQSAADGLVVCVNCTHKWSTHCMIQSTFPPKFQ
jgi:hypothetical protein